MSSLPPPLFIFSQLEGISNETCYAENQVNAATIGPGHDGIHRHRGPDRRRRHRRMPCRISAHCMGMKHSPFFDTGRRQVRRSRRGTERTPRRVAANCRNEWNSNGKYGLIPTLTCLQTCPPRQVWSKGVHAQSRSLPVLVTATRWSRAFPRRRSTAFILAPQPRTIRGQVAPRYRMCSKAMTVPCKRARFWREKLPALTSIPCLPRLRKS